jgi:hypothetical protein
MVCFGSLGDGVKILGAILVGVTVLAVSAFFIVRSFEDRVTDEFVSQVSLLAIPEGWKPLDDIVRREQFLCMSTNPCPSIARRWQADTGATVKDLEQIASPAGLVFSVEGTCQRPANEAGETIVCTGRAVKDGYDYQLTVVSEDTQGNLQVALDVRPS